MDEDIVLSHDALRFKTAHDLKSEIHGIRIDMLRAELALAWAFVMINMVTIVGSNIASIFGVDPIVLMTFLVSVLVVSGSGSILWYFKMEDDCKKMRISLENEWAMIRTWELEQEKLKGLQK